MVDIRVFLLVIAAYFLGSIPAAYLVAKWRRGIDIRQYGSGNVGASNVLSVVSKRWAVAVTLFDIGKGALIVWVAQMLDMSAGQQAAAGVAAIIGHNWSVFLRFQGGRGIFTSLGVIAMLSPWLGLFAPVFSYLFAPFRQLSLGVLLALIIIPVLSWTIGPQIGIGEPLPTSLGLFAILGLVIIRRVFEPRTEISASVPKGELLINRLLFDRDIRNREEWLHQRRQADRQAE
ncbi:MAG: glycerol-3-phosphate acyltransferase, partial [Dehalococcoidales bacterium]